MHWNYYTNFNANYCKLTPTLYNVPNILHQLYPMTVPPPMNTKLTVAEVVMAVKTEGLSKEMKRRAFFDL